MKVFRLLKSNSELAKAEVLSLLATDKYEQADNLLIVEDDSGTDFRNRLGYTHSVYTFLFAANEDELEKKAAAFDWQSIYKNNFYVRTSGKNRSKQLAALIFNKLKDPVVKVKDSDTIIDFFFLKHKVVCVAFLYDVDKSYLKRKAHLRPRLHPTSMNPGLARAMVNLTGLTKGSLLDPFCGSAGILIEAGLMGFKITGYDIDAEQLERAEENLNHYSLEHKLEKKDAVEIKNRFDCVVTDVPYGKNSKASDKKKLYSDFLKNAKKITSNLIVAFSSSPELKDMIKKSGWEINNNFSVYIHSTMTREIFKLSLSHH